MITTVVVTQFEFMDNDHTNFDAYLNVPFHSKTFFAKLYFLNQNENAAKSIIRIVLLFILCNMKYEAKEAK